MCDHHQAYTQCRNYDFLEICELQETGRSGGNARIMRGRLGQKMIGIKRVPTKTSRHPSDDELQLAALRREISVWWKLRNSNSNVLELLGVVTFRKDQSNMSECYLLQSPIFYYYENEDLVEYLGRNQLNNLHQVNLFKDITTGLNYIHSHKIVHGDLKRANVLIDHEQHAKICDFGSSYAVGECPGSCPARPPEDTQALATHIYLSPEIWDLEEQTSYRSDIWALGCLLFEVQTGKRVYDGKTDKQTMYNMTIKELPPATIEKFPSDDFSQALGQVAIGCLSPDPQDRLTSQQVLQKLNEINTVEI